MDEKEKKEIPCVENHLPEFFGQIIDIFEDFLEEKGVVLTNPEREERLEEEEDPETVAIIYGSDYDRLLEPLEQMMDFWGLTETIRETRTWNRKGEGNE